MAHCCQNRNLVSSHFKIYFFRVKKLSTKLFFKKLKIVMVHCYQRRNLASLLFDGKNIFLDFQMNHGCQYSSLSPLSRSQRVLYFYLTENVFNPSHIESQKPWKGQTAYLPVLLALRKWFFKIFWVKYAFWYIMYRKYRS